MNLRVKVTWQESHAKCCSLGMRPIWFRDAFEMQCVSKEMSSNWTLNQNYWTAATQQSCWGQWSWCTVDGPLPLGQGMQWADKQPDNAQGIEGCVHLRVFKNGSLPALSDRNCSQKYFLACKVRIFTYSLKYDFWV
jgi:hypothetical protein